MRGKCREALLLLFAVLVVLSAVFSMTKGSVEIEAVEIISALSGKPLGTHEQIIMNIRLPRTLLAGLVGMNLALSGAILQAIMKNPLADPHIIGISSGAGLLGILMILAFPSYAYLVTPVAFLGAMGAAIAIYILAWKNGIRPIRIILAGVAVSAFLGAGISGLLIFYSDRVQGALLFMIGGLSGRSWGQVSMILPYAIGGGMLALFASRTLNVLQLGDDIAKGLGTSVERARILLTAVAALLAASSVSVVGLLGFIGLIVPHAARLIIGSDYRYLLPAAALLGASVLIFSDTLARILFAPVELPVGILMAVLGAPFFLYLLRREL